MFRAECGQSGMDMKRAKTEAEVRDQREPIGERIMAKKSEVPKS
jgi:hypothetical protein